MFQFRFLTNFLFLSKIKYLFFDKIISLVFVIF